MPTATVRGIRLYYELHGGSGEPLVLVHGYTGDITDWRHQIPEFSRTYRVLVMDLRGHGRSEAPSDRSTYTIPQMASDVENLVEQVGFDRYHLLGHSMGGGIVQEIALHSPQKLLSLILHDTSLKFAMTGDPVMENWRNTRMTLAESGDMAAVAALPPPVPPPPHMPAD
ncbi:MAG: alpha/beta hydrolase, partial [Dehalococcoidia bacterium]